jgi:hypothetical protein
VFKVRELEVDRATFAPVKPASLSFSNISGNAAKANWTNQTSAAEEITGYEWRINGGSWNSVASSPANLTGLSANTFYSFDVRAVDSAGIRGPEETGSFTTPPPAVTLDNVSVSGELSMGSMSFSYGLTTGGNVSVTGSAVSVSGPASTSWITPQVGMNLYQAKATSACPYKTGTYGTWQTLGAGVTRSWGVSLTPNKTANCTITVQISAIANPTVILDSATINVEMTTVP